MKKILLSTILLISVLAANAQRTSIGVTGGVGTAWMSDVAQEVTLNPVWNAGASLVYSTDNHWGIGLDVKYSKEGVRFIYPGVGAYTGQTMATRIVSDYIRVPLRGIYFFNSSSKKVRPNISLGPNLGFLIGSESRNYDGNNELLTTTDVKSSFNAIDLGVQGTIGASFMLSDGIWLSTDVAYNRGFIKQNKFGTNTMLNSNLAFNIGLRFGIGN